MWKVIYDNDTGLLDDTFHEWWNITDGNRSFVSENEADANWLAEQLNKL